MLAENFIAATLTSRPHNAQTSNALKDVGIFLHEFQPQSTLRHGYKKSSTQSQCIAISDSHIFAAQAGKAVINVYSREKGNQEATVPFPDRINSLVYAEQAAVLVLGTEDGKLFLWEVASGRVSTSAASHLQPVTSLVLTPNYEYILSGSEDSSIHIWSLTELITFNQAQNDFNSGEAPSKIPIRTFATHRKGIKALAVGHSTSNTNFAVSASSDQTCYMWDIESCQILRTILLASVPSSIALDPVDRVVYLGSSDGTVQNIDIFTGLTDASKSSIFNSTNKAPLQLRPEDSWITSSADTGAICCLTLSYDGTSLISGHDSGSIIRWDVAKHRIASEITNVVQPVTSVHMLKPDGFRQNNPRFNTPIIVKPRLELNTEPEVGSVGIPANYVFISQIRDQSEFDDDISAAIMSNGFSQSLLDDALQSLNKQVLPRNGSDRATVAQDLAKMEALQAENASLKSKQAAQSRQIQASRERSRARMKRRDALGLEKREAYFAAQKQGKDGDEAMKPYERRETEIDVESDESSLLPAPGEKDVDMEL